MTLTISLQGESASPVLAGLGTGRIHRCAVCNRGSSNAITCWVRIIEGSSPSTACIRFLISVNTSARLWQDIY